MSRPYDAQDSYHVPSTAERAARIRREAKMIAEARAQLDAGQGIADADLEAWLDRLEDDETAPLPLGRTRHPT
jgi:hypothetical protein